MNEVLDAINVIRKYFENPDNFKTTKNKLQGILISNYLDVISDDFVKNYIEPDLKEQAKEIIFDSGAKA